ncbi:hypothetical protein FXN61_40605 [Lentzea sp. PSKA42]|uniref:Secreted protein n=1 Tax=Lentzea indica TaxID=2604800 RepID=A0ABX1FVY9_9PSEU|nr:hypothetical protein [Lentzea indica]NKE62692.1 hypothetical protein [Lentzea indica]
MKLNLLVYGLIALVLVVPGFFIIGDMFSEPEVGDCAEPVSKSDGKFDMNETDCTSPEAVYRLVKLEQKKSCPKGDYLVQTASRAGKPAGLKHYCFVLNTKEGDCLKRGSAFHERVACGTGGSQRVSKVANADDRSLCGTDEARTYPDPATTICLKTV